MKTIYSILSKSIVEFHAHPDFSWCFGINITRVWKGLWHIGILCFTISISFWNKSKLWDEENNGMEETICLQNSTMNQ